MKKAEEMYAYARNHKLGFNLTPIIGGWLQKKHFKLKIFFFEAKMLFRVTLFPNVLVISLSTST